MKLMLEIIIYSSKFGFAQLATEAGFCSAVVILIIAAAVLKVQIMSTSLKIYHTVLFTPMYQAMTFLLTGIFGIVYLDEFEESRVREVNAQIYLYILVSDRFSNKVSWI